MNDLDIIDYFDSNLDVTIVELSRLSGQSEFYVKNLLMNTGASEYQKMQGLDVEGLK
jgi:hypothetical protein